MLEATRKDIHNDAVECQVIATELAGEEHAADAYVRHKGVEDGGVDGEDAEREDAKWGCTSCEDVEDADGED